MTVKIRLARYGARKNPSYRVVVAESLNPRDGKFIEIIGNYDPQSEPSDIHIDAERAKEWLNNGAQPTKQARKLLKISGAL